MYNYKSCSINNNIFDQTKCRLCHYIIQQIEAQIYTGNRVKKIGNMRPQYIVGGYFIHTLCCGRFFSGTFDKIKKM